MVGKMGGYRNDEAFNGERGEEHGDHAVVSSVESQRLG